MQNTRKSNLDYTTGYCGPQDEALSGGVVHGFYCSLERGHEGDHQRDLSEETGMDAASRLIWISVPGDEYHAMIGSVTVILKPGRGGRATLMDSKPGVFYRRERGTLTGPMENAMRVAEDRYLV